MTGRPKKKPGRKKTWKQVPDDRKKWTAQAEELWLMYGRLKQGHRKTKKTLPNQTEEPTKRDADVVLSPKRVGIQTRRNCGAAIQAHRGKEKRGGGEVSYL